MSLTDAQKRMLNDRVFPPGTDDALAGHKPGDFAEAALQKVISVPLTVTGGATVTTGVFASTGKRWKVDSVSVAFLTVPASAAGAVTLDVFKAVEGAADVSVLAAAQSLEAAALTAERSARPVLTGTDANRTLDENNMLYANVVAAAVENAGSGGVLTVVLSQIV